MINVGLHRLGRSSSCFASGSRFLVVSIRISAMGTRAGKKACSHRSVSFEQRVKCTELTSTPSHAHCAYRSVYQKKTDRATMATSNVRKGGLSRFHVLRALEGSPFRPLASPSCCATGASSTSIDRLPPRGSCDSASPVINSVVMVSSIGLSTRRSSAAYQIQRVKTLTKRCARVETRREAVRPKC